MTVQCGGGGRGDVCGGKRGYLLMRVYGLGFRVA
jgi:hypothetical protein